MIEGLQSHVMCVPVIHIPSNGHLVWSTKGNQLRVPDDRLYCGNSQCAILPTREMF